MVIAWICGGVVKDDITRVIYLAKIRKVLVYIQNVEKWKYLIPIIFRPKRSEYSLSSSQS